MKKILLPLCALLLLATPVLAQQADNKPAPREMADDALREMRKSDPRSAQLFQSAIQRGDLAGARAIYRDFKKSGGEERGGREGEPEQALPAAAPPEPSFFEKTLSGGFPEQPKSLEQFGYDLFNRTASTFTPQSISAVGPDYLIGPGDQFTLTLWGTTEGIYTLQVTKEGDVTLPKVGVVPVSGVRFGGLEKTLKRHLSRYYSNFNLSVAMGGLKSNTIYVVGEVATPGSYFLPSLTTVYGALFSAGGPSKRGSLRNIQVLRSGRVIRNIDLYDFLLKGDRSQDIRLRNEDTVFVPLIGPIAGVEGMVYRPAIYELKGRETIDEVVAMAGGFMPTALGGRLQVARYADNEKKMILDLQIAARGSDPGKAAGAMREKVRNMDLITIRPVYDQIWETVNLNGAVAHPGDFAWRPDLKVKEIIGQGGLLPVSDLGKAEIIRLNEDFSDRIIIPVDIRALLDGDEQQNVPLRPQDRIRIYSMYRQAEKITLSGEVARPGVYEIMDGERLSGLMKRAGGFTSHSYVYGTVFKRKTVQDSESRNLQTLISRMQSQVLQNAAGNAATAVSAEEAAYAKAELNLNQGLLNNLKTMQEQLAGRVAVNITENIDEWAGSKDDLLLQDGDSIIIPKKPQEVLILGEIHSPGAQIHEPGMTVKDYIERTGGYTKYAEEDDIFIVQANGFAYGADSPSVGNINRVKLQAGDAVFVPQKMERHATMRTTRDIIDILFKTAVTLATITVIF